MAKKAEKSNKISDKELETLTSLQNEVTNILAQVGNTDVVKAQLLSKHAEIQERWNENAKLLEEAYGNVNIDLSSGEIKEIEEQEA